MTIRELVIAVIFLVIGVPLLSIRKSLHCRGYQIVRASGRQQKVDSSSMPYLEFTPYGRVLAYLLKKLGYATTTLNWGCGGGFVEERYFGNVITGVVSVNVDVGPFGQLAMKVFGLTYAVGRAYVYHKSYAGGFADMHISLTPVPLP
jgi:hypothetical protein